MTRLSLWLAGTVPLTLTLALAAVASPEAPAAAGPAPTQAAGALGGGSAGWLGGFEGPGAVSSRAVASFAEPFALAAPVAPRPAAGAAEPMADGPCEVWEVRYKILPGSTISVEDTVFGAGDGVYPAGTGHVVLRLPDAGGQPAAGRGDIIGFSLTSDITAKSNVAGFKVEVRTVSTAKLSHDSCGSAGHGTFDGTKLAWAGRVRGYQATGRMHCEGSLCGKFGAPPEGDSDYVLEPHDVDFRPFGFADGVSGFGMPASLVAEQSKPKQKSYLTLFASETARACVPRPAGCGG